MLHIDLTLEDVRMIANYRPDTSDWSAAFLDHFTGKEAHTYIDGTTMASLVAIAMHPDGEVTIPDYATVEKVFEKLPPELRMIP